VRAKITLNSLTPPLSQRERELKVAN